jgi:UDP-N-acetylmuramoyl-L-alanyl-D-glutamate--2,6-diaminopimelate ligase
MILEYLVDAVDVPTDVVGSGRVVIEGLSLDSRRVHPGDLFFARSGQRQDGHRYVRDAIASGAAAVVATHAEPEWAAVPVVLTADVPRCLALMAARFHGEPSCRLATVAVTGTNGKTTTTYLLEAIWRAAGRSAGVIGTISYRHAGAVHAAPLTTPEACDLQAELAGMVRDGVAAVAVEVSSHALALDRVRGCQWDAGVFTNLSHDHLDFHHDLESYFAAKARLFREHLPASTKPDPVAVVNIDDPYGRRLAAEYRGRLVTFGRDASATVHPCGVERSLAGLHGALSVAGQALPIASRLVGEPHLDNLMAAAGAAYGLGIPLATIAAGLEACAVVPGRVERIDDGDGVAVFVDYAHTPDALARVLATLRPLCAGRLIAVFGCGGDRDRTKRPIMGEAAARACDLVILTSDNPRTEDPTVILGEIEAGVIRGGMARTVVGSGPAVRRGYGVEADRRGAIALALSLACRGDIVVIAGKGHEDYQIVGTEKRVFDDRVEVRALLGRGAAAMAEI